MDISLQRKIDRIIGSFICRVFSLFPKRKIKQSNTIRPNKILVIILSEMGSLLLAKPMFDYIQERYPHASIYVMLFKKNREFLEILNIVPDSNIFTVDSDSIINLLLDSSRIISRIRREMIDTVIDCELFSRISSIYSFLSCASIRVGFHPYTQEGLFRGNFINHPVLYNPYHHISQQFLTLAKAIESEQFPKAKYSLEKKDINIPSFKPGQEETAVLWQRLTGDFPHISDKNFALIYPSGGLLPIRAWPLENFCIVANDLIRQGYVVAIIGMKEDKKLADVILDYCRNKDCIDLTGYTKSVRELMILFHHASLLITNDGGPGHFASMTPVPTIILYGPETPTLYGPLDKKTFQCYSSLSCSPCLTAYNHRNSPCDGDNLCLKSISPKDVLGKAYEFLEQKIHP